MPSPQWHQHCNILEGLSAIQLSAGWGVSGADAQQLEFAVAVAKPPRGGSALDSSWSVIDEARHSADRICGIEQPFVLAT